MTSSFLTPPRMRQQMWAVVAILALLVMEATTASLWYQAIFRPAAASFAAIFAILFTISAVSHLMSRVMAALKWRMGYRQWALLGWVTITIFASLKLIIYPHTSLSLFELLRLPVEFIVRADAPAVYFFHLLYIILLIWRGVALARGPITLYVAQISFQIGLAALLFYGMVFALVFPIEAAVGMYLYLFSGLTAMSSARISNLSDLRGGRIPRFGPGWMISILLASLALVGLAVLSGWLASGQVVYFLASVLVGLFAILTALVLMLLSPLLILLADLLPRLIDVFQSLWERLRGIRANEQIQEIIQRLSEGLDKITPLVLASRGLILAAVIGGIILAILLALRLRDIFQRLAEEDETGKAEPEETDNLLKRLLNQLAKGARGLRLHRPGQLLAAARIRQIYRQMMSLCQKLGDPRPSSSTPLEFLPRLEALFSEEKAGVQAITNAYIKVRYGEFPETRGEVETVELAWLHLRRQARKKLAAKRRQ